MTILIYFLTIVFGIVCFVIMKKKRYKVMPLICLIMFICFIGCGIVSILSLTLPMVRFWFIHWEQLYWVWYLFWLG